MYVKQIRIESLGNSSYLVGSEQSKECAVIDPLRDIDLYVREAEAQGFRITHSLETHVHNDFISGSRELAARTGTTIGASAAGGLLFDHRPLKKGDAITIGEVRLEVIATPGHTPEHISFLATETSKGGPDALFSGGALLVGGVARSDLMGKQIAPFLDRWFYRTIRQELQQLDDDVAVYPTHGGGSFCLASPSGTGGGTTSTVGQERATNPYFQAASEEDFLELALGKSPSFPAYYKRMAAINRRGPHILGHLPQLYPLAPREVWVRVQGEGIAIDARDIHLYAASHIPGAYSIPLGDSFGTWAGWLVEPGKPLVLVIEEPSATEEAARQLVRIGYDALEGYLDGGMEAREKARLPVAHLRTVTPSDLSREMESGNGPLPLDVRFDHEWRLGHVPDALHVELGQLPEHADGLPRDRAYATLCAMGARATIAASVLEREGFKDVAVVTGGTQAWVKSGYPLEKEGQ